MPLLRGQIPNFFPKTRNGRLPLNEECKTVWMILVLSILVASKKSRPQSTYLISLWCSFRQMPSSRHSAPRAACWNILPDQKTSQQFSSSCATWYWTLRVHFLKSLSILFSSSWPHFSTGWWPALPMRRERTALLLNNMLTTRSTSSKSPGHLAGHLPDQLGHLWALEGCVAVHCEESAFFGVRAFAERNVFGEGTILTH